jgi:diguanylate cyclase (GGDEF)-like protein
MPNLHMPTLVAVVSAMALVMMGVVLLMRHSWNHVQIDGLAEWSAAPFCALLGAILVGSRNWLHPALSNALPHALYTTGAIAFMLGCARFHGLQLARKPWALLLLVEAGLLIWFSTGQPSYSNRVAIGSLCLALVLLFTTRLLWQQTPAGLSRNFTVGVLVLQGTIALCRGVHGLVLDIQDDAPEIQAAQTLYLGAYSVAILSLGLSVILMVADRFNRELQHQATHDPLTGALSRRAFNQTLLAEWTRHQRHNRPVALMMLDLDHFKRVNDRFGHPTGDQTLIQFVHRVHQILRQPEQLARIGGEEFVALLRDTTAEQAGVLAERLRVEFSDRYHPDLPRCTVSIGISAMRADDTDPQSVVGRSDTALYAAKREGRNCVRIA